MYIATLPRAQKAWGKAQTDCLLFFHQICSHESVCHIRRCLSAERGSICQCKDHRIGIVVLSEIAPSVSITNAIFFRRGHVISSPGELTALDDVIDLICDALGTDVANEVSSLLLLDAVRPGARRQLCSAADRYRGIPDILAQAFDRIETDIEQPPTPADTGKIGLDCHAIGG